MKKNILKQILTIGGATLFLALPVLAQEHKWAGRALDDLEWTIHEELAVLPLHGVFDTLNFAVEGKTVTLTGHVVNERVKQSAEGAVKRLPGIESVVNQIEVLPASQRDDALRKNVYRAIYQNRSLEKYGTREIPTIHIIVKEGWVTLEGAVDSEADRSLARLQALKATSHVSDNLRVTAEPSEGQ